MARPPRVSTPTTKAFADRLSDLVQIKKSEGLSHDEISRQIGVSSGVLSEWMSDNKTASIENLAKLSKYFGVSADYLLGLAALKTPDVDIQKACEITGLSEDAISVLQDSFHASDALNTFLLERNFRNLLMNMLYFNYAVIASGLHYQIFNSDTCNESEKDDLLKSIYDSQAVLEDIKGALKTYIIVKENHDVLLPSDEGCFSPEDFYELRINRNLSALLHDITGDKWWFSAEAIINEVQGNFT